jgi:tight adherence protein B
MSILYYILALLFWFITGVVVMLFFYEPVRKWVGAYNAKYAEELAHFFRQGKKPGDPARIRSILFWSEVGSFLAGTAISGNPFFGFWAVGFAFFAIRYMARLLHAKELERFDSQMLDITYAFRNSLKAGMSLQQAMQLIANDFANPSADQFRMVLREIQIGASIEEALHHIEERIPNAELKIMVNAIEILRQTGGNMVETFESLAETLKNRKKVEGKIKSLTAQGRAQAIILCVMPFAMALILWFLNREYISPLFNTLLGWVILSVVIALVSVGWVIIQKVIAIEV